MLERAIVIVAGLGAVGCGDEPTSTCDVPNGNAYMPLHVGNTWALDVRDAARDIPLGEKTWSVTADVGNNTFIIENRGMRPGRRWLVDDGERYAWVRTVWEDSNGNPLADEYYDPPATRLRYSKMTLGDTWVEPARTKTTISIVGDPNAGVAPCTDWNEQLGAQNLALCPAASMHTETIADETWAITATDRMISVPAGDFSALCHKRMCAPGACTEGEYCFAQGVGKVYEMGTEEDTLLSYCLR